MPCMEQAIAKFRNEQFQLNNNQWLIPTSEVSLTNMVSNSILEYDKLPLRFVTSTPVLERRLVLQERIQKV